MKDSLKNLWAGALGKDSGILLRFTSSIILCFLILCLCLLIVCFLGTSFHYFLFLSSRFKGLIDLLLFTMIAVPQAATIGLHLYFKTTKAKEETSES